MNDGSVPGPAPPAPAAAPAATGRRSPNAPSADRSPLTPFLGTKLRLLTWIAVVAVVWVHAYNLGSRARLGENAPDMSGAPGAAGFVQYLVSQALARWPAALLFAISGFLFFRTLVPATDQFLAKYRRRARTLAVPFLLWSAWGVALYVTLHALPLDSGYVSPGALERLTPAALLEMLLVRPVAYPLWFLQALLFCVLVSPLLWALVRFVQVAALLPFAALWLSNVGVGGSNYVNFKALLFFTLGALIAVRLREGRWVPLTGLGAAERSQALGRFLLPSFVLAALLFTWLLRAETAWWAGGLHKALMCFAVAALWFGYDAYLAPLARRPAVMWAAGFSFFVYAAHEPPLMIAKRVLMRWAGGPAAGDAAVVLVYFAAPLVTIAACLVAGWALRRWARPAYALMTGRR
ncbi:MAG: acyltransferase [Actinomycetota bacterium]|nr:MAG: acyltransferase [Actinomycetota bacterium]